MCDFFHIFLTDLFQNSIKRWRNERQARVWRLPFATRLTTRQRKRVQAVRRMGIALPIVLGGMKNIENDTHERGKSLAKMCCLIYI